MINTERLLLRPYRQNDADNLFRVLSDMETMQCWPTPFTIDAVRNWISRSRVSYDAIGIGRYAVLRKIDRQLIGDCGVVHLEVDGESVNDLGYIFHRAVWGRGLATEAALAIRDFAFSKAGLVALHANMPRTHVASRRVAEKIGMRHVKTFRNPRNRHVLTRLYYVRRANVSG